MRPAGIATALQIRQLVIVIAGTVIAVAAATPAHAAFATAPGASRVSGPGPVVRYSVQVERGMGVRAATFAAAVEQTLGDRRSWGAGGQRGFRRVSRGPVAFRVVLARPATTDRLCAPLRTVRRYSCYMNGRAVVNLARWRTGAAPYAGNLALYRKYVVNHEVGHALGHGHRGCPRAGVLAPVMMQQTKGVGSCRVNGWPRPAARRIVQWCSISVYRPADGSALVARVHARYGPGGQDVRIGVYDDGRWDGRVSARLNENGRTRVAVPGTEAAGHWTVRARVLRTAQLGQCSAVTTYRG